MLLFAFYPYYGSFTCHLSETLLCHFPVSTDSSNHTFFFCCIFGSYTSGLVHVVNQKFFLYLFFQQPYMSLALQDQTVIFPVSLFPVIAFDSYFIKHMMWLWTSSNDFANLFYGSQRIQDIISPQCLLLRGNILTNPSLPAACADNPQMRWHGWTIIHSLHLASSYLLTVLLIVKHNNTSNYSQGRILSSWSGGGSKQQVRLEGEFASSPITARVVKMAGKREQ